MSSEIATWGMIRSKVPSFPAPAAGRENECLTKSEILSFGGENVRIEGSYGDGECVMLDNVLPTKDIVLGYVDANNKVHYIATLMNNPTFSKAEIKSIMGDNNSAIIFVGYNNFMNATAFQAEIKVKIGDLWIKIPCINNSGSCVYSTPLTKINNNSCYAEGVLDFMNPLLREFHELRIDAKDATGAIIERSPTINFTLKD